MKLFISYSRDDKAWTYELWRQVRDEGHDAWIDRRIVPAADWWVTILKEIEAADVFVYVMTPKSVESIYCRGELDYALALNKPVLPLMLKRCDLPQPLRKRRVQYQVISDDLSMDRVLLKMEQGLGELRLALFRGEYAPQNAPRPDVPTPQQNPEHVFEAFAMAEEAAAEENITLAEQLFGQVIAADPEGLGAAARERLDEIMRERDRATAYANVKRLAENPVTRKGAQAAWRAFVRQYPDYDDPDGLAAALANNPKPRNPVGTAFSPSEPANPKPSAADAQKRVPTAKPSAKPAPVTADDLTRRTRAILPPPFAWIEIPAGRVTLEKGGYVPKDGMTVDVPAFMIAKYPVTNAQFAKFIEAGGYKNRDWWTDDGWQHRQDKNWTEPRYWTDDEFNGAEYPVVGVSWFEAVAFCNWLDEAVFGANGRAQHAAPLPGRVMLPTEAQWQRAAGGDDGREYPYGDTVDENRANTGESGIKRTTPVTQYEGKGDSPFGVVDMSGNVFEWCLTDYKSGANDVNRIENRPCVVRGGAFNALDFYSRCAYRFDRDPGSRFISYGLRVVCGAEG